MQAPDVKGLIKEYNSTKREFLLELFREYESIPFAKSIKNFVGVVNDIYLQELPYSKMKVKYQLLEQQIVEIANLGTPQEYFKVPFKFCFSRNTGKAMSLVNSSEYMDVLKILCRSIKSRDSKLEVDLHNRGIKPPSQIPAQNLGMSTFKKRKTINNTPPMDIQEKDKVPLNGLEFFFSHLMIRIYQIPICFYDSSEFE